MSSDRHDDVDAQLEGLFGAVFELGNGCVEL